MRRQDIFDDFDIDFGCQQTSAIIAAVEIKTFIPWRATEKKSQKTATLCKH